MEEKNTFYPNVWQSIGLTAWVSSSPFCMGP